MPESNISRGISSALLSLMNRRYATSNSSSSLAFSVPPSFVWSAVRSASDVSRMLCSRLRRRSSSGDGPIGPEAPKRLLNALSAGTLSAGDLLRRIQNGRAQDYVYGVACGLLALLVASQIWR